MSCSKEQRKDIHFPGAPGTRPAARHRGEGFTLIEILIATSILTLGLVGILALFPVAMKAGRDVVEDSNSVVIAQSVVNAIRSGIRNSKGYTKKNEAESYFLLRHDGVRDKVPVDPRLIKSTGDYYILLPRFRENASFSGTDQRRKALKSAKALVYPGGKVLRAGDKIEKVYELGRNLIPNLGTQDALRRNFLNLGENEVASKAFLQNDRVLRDFTNEILRQYSFAIKVRNSYFDADSAPDKSYRPANKLYHFTVLIFRQFPEDPVDEDNEDPTPVMKVFFEAAI